MSDFQDRPARQMYPIDPPVPCSGCGKPIDKVPFEPDPARFQYLKCYDCFKAKKAAFGR